VPIWCSCHSSMPRKKPLMSCWPHAGPDRRLPRVPCQALRPSWHGQSTIGANGDETMQPCCTRRRWRCVRPRTILVRRIGFLSTIGAGRKPSRAPLPGRFAAWCGRLGIL
jgi:hypothetical protein